MSMLGKSSIVPIAIALGGVFGLIALILIETMRTVESGMRRFQAHPYWIAAGGGAVLALFYTIVGDAYAGLGVDVIKASLAGAGQVFVLAFLFKIVATAVTLETGGSGGIVTPLFFIGSTSGAAIA
jgi:H+/Cl- antiporter ClcA